MPSLRTFLDSLPESEVLTVEEPVDLDYSGTALVLELEKRKRFPVVRFENARGFDMPVVMNLFSDRRRIERMAGAPAGGFHAHWAHIVDRLMPPEVFCNRLDPSSQNGVAAKLALDATRGAGFDAIRTSLPAEALAFAKRVAG